MAEQQKSAAAWVNEGDAAFRAQNHEAALDHYESALQVDEGHEAALLKRNTCLHVLSRFEEALVAAEETLRHHPRSSAAWVQKGATLGALDQLAASLYCFQEALQHDPENSQAMFFKAMAEEGIGLLEEARESYQAFLDAAHPSLEGQIRHAHDRISQL